MTLTVNGLNKNNTALEMYNQMQAVDSLAKVMEYTEFIQSKNVTDRFLELDLTNIKMYADELTEEENIDTFKRVLKADRVAIIDTLSK